MKSNELMVDDWVYNKYIDKPMQIYPTIFSQMFRSNPNATTEDYNIFPIPLTPEILEKNGFSDKYAEDDLSYATDYSGDVIAVHICGNGGIMDEMYFNYVHELQHAMRLCGIEKEIIL